MSEKNKQPKIEYSRPYGCINAADEKNSKFFDDEEEIGKKELLKYKIINLKIYTKVINEHNRIIGIEYTLRNLFNGKDIVMSRKVSNEFDDHITLDIRNSEYLNEILVRFPNDIQFITQLSFITNKHNNITAGEEEGELRTINLESENLESENIIILGMYGYVSDNLTCIGCIYTAFTSFTSSILFRFFMLRHFAKKDEEFKKKWDEKYNELTPEYKMLWRTVNLPDNCFYKIVRACL
jgi:hypothetical protein